MEQGFEISPKHAGPATVTSVSHHGYVAAKLTPAWWETDDDRRQSSRAILAPLLREPENGDEV